MRVILTAALAVVALAAPAAAASLEDLVKAMGADKVKTIAFSGQGIVNAVGQSMNPTAQWPRITLKSYKFVANYGTDAAAEEQTIAQLEDPPRGGGGQPFVGDVNRRSGLVGVTGWAGVGTSVGPVRTTAPLLHDLWTTPHGVIKAAQAAGAKVGARNVGGKSMTAVSFAKPGAFRATALFGADNLLVRVEARVTDFVLGDMPVVTTYADYKDFDGVKFPTKITRFSGGFQSLDLERHGGDSQRAGRDCGTGRARSTQRGREVDERRQRHLVPAGRVAPFRADRDEQPRDHVRGAAQ